jgi:hypothetical protein
MFSPRSAASMPGNDNRGARGLALGTRSAASAWRAGRELGLKAQINTTVAWHNLAGCPSSAVEP